MKASLISKVLHFSVLIYAAVLLAGCVTTATDWNQRVGHYTFNQAVAQLGWPDKQIKLSDGRIASQWITLHGSSDYQSGNSAGVSTFGMAGNTGPLTYKDHVLELTFGADGKLVSWAKNY